MSTAGRTYEQLHVDQAWAYGRHADGELMHAVADLPTGRALDLGGGQGRHALALAARGFDVEVVDSSRTALEQLRQAAGAESLSIETVHANVAFYRPRPGLQLVVAALLFHVPARHAAMQAARAAGEALHPGGALYLSVPGYTDRTRRLVSEVLERAGCIRQWCLNHPVTPAERPRLPVPRRNETRALGLKS